MSLQYNVLHALERRQVRYLVSGDAALAHHAVTRELDRSRVMEYFIDFGMQNRQRLAGALGDLYAEQVLPAPIFYSQALSWPDEVQLVTELNGLDFGKCYERRCMVRMGDMVVPLLSRGDTGIQYSFDDRSLAMLRQGDRIRAMERVLQPSELVMRLQQKRRSIDEDRRAM